MRGLRDTTIILLMFDTAARIQELLDLTPADIDTTVGRGRVTLTGKGRKTQGLETTPSRRGQYSLAVDSRFTLAGWTALVIRSSPLCPVQVGPLPLLIGELAKPRLRLCHTDTVSRVAAPL